jgi:signal transduction histidine kinase
MSLIRALLTIEVRTEQDVVLARQRARQIGGLLGFDLQAQTKLGTAVSEIVRNAFRYAGGGKVMFQLDDGDLRRLVVIVTDNGPGIPDLKSVLEGRYVSKTGMGMGLIGTRRIMDEFEIICPEHGGTRVLMAKYMSARAAPITNDTLASIGAVLAKGLPGDPLGEVQQQNQELMRVLEELHQRQQELILLNKELEDTNRGVVALYAELESRSDFLRKSSEVKTRFLSNMTHEFRTPLNSIVALSRMLKERCDGDLTVEQDRQVDFIIRSTESLSELVDDLLDISKVEAGKVVVRPANFSVRNLFGSLKGMLRPLLGANSVVSLHFEEPPASLQLFSDEGKVSQVLRNFISNALKFTECGEVRVSASLGAGDRIIFSVADTGIGIKPEDLPMIFEEFGQVESHIAQRFKGSGLGLPLSKRLAELLGGRVSVTSEHCIGSVFTLELPRTYRGPLHASILEPALAPGHGYKRQALVIDDDDVSRYLLRNLLPSVFEVVETASGVDGIETANRLHPDVVFLDLNMPQMSGFQVLEHLKSDAATKDIPVIIYSAHEMDAAVSQRLTKADGILSAKGGDVQTARVAARRALEKVGLIPVGSGGADV